MSLEEPADSVAEPERRASTEDWKKALDRVVPCCVVLKVTQTRAFDTEAAGSAYATGFIVDKQRGLILTNRHVVTPGPIVAESIFLNREELPVYPLYYDPIHDFAFLRFDPSRLQFMEVSEVPLAPEAATVGLDIRVVGNDSGEKVSILAGTLARLDRDAPVYGRKGYNDFNTFYLQAASGTKGGSSGSPVIDCQGRAVGLNAGGKNKAASAYYLPLERVVRALKLIQDAFRPGTEWPCPFIPRGDLQTTFVFKGFDEVRRLGLQQETERRVRNSKSAPTPEGPQHSTGMLVVDSVVPGSPCGGIIEAGDVLVEVNGQVVTHFLTLEELLDNAAQDRMAGGPGKVQLLLERGGKPINAEVEVTDLHSVTPNCFLELAGGAVHALSYQQARNNRAVVGQVYVAEPGYMLGRANVPKCAIITALNGKPTPDLITFATVLRTLPHGARAPLEYLTFSERHRRKNAILHVDRQWYGPPVFWTRDDAAGAWHPTVDYPPGAPPPPEPSIKLMSNAGGELSGHPNGHCNVVPPMDAEQMPVASATGVVSPREGSLAERQTPDLQDFAHDYFLLPFLLWRAISAHPRILRFSAAIAAPACNDLDELLRCCLVLVDIDIPLVALSDGVHSRSFAGNGLVVYAGERVGLVLVDRNTVAVGPCDVNLSFGAHPAEISGRVRFLHPLHNFALVSYDPAALPPEARAKVRAAEMLPYPPLKRGEPVRLVGLTKHLRVMQRTSTVTNATAALTIPSAEVPRFRAVHEEVIKLDQDFGATFSGCLTDNRGRVRGLWCSYSEQVQENGPVDKEEREWCAGLHAAVFFPWVEQLARLLDQGAPAPPPAVSVLDAELEAVLLSKAAQFGLPAEWVTRLDQLDPERRQVLRVRSCVAQSHASKVLRSGDMLLAMSGRPVTCFQDVERLIKQGQQGPGSAPGRPSMHLTIYRSGCVLDVEVVLGREDGMGTGRLVHWCGAQLQAPHRGVRELGFLPEGAAGVYISRWHHGSPAHRYGLYALHWIQQVNGVDTPDLDSFLAAVAGCGDGQFVRLKVCHLETTQPKVLTLKMDLQYWPTWELRLDPNTCTWRRLQHSPFPFRPASAMTPS
ncbi:trypsin family [Volvox carteri f. nagariensis]|uniref:Trypsin family n=1 Tax=Volvox carteri f. nagariensis TaxID=3068 RepID=D8TKS5_VOLCA|nr:trypsin family [Volvox carteri f. nagariensis]EFJ52115.1 trypsin family [Volvox carteri f. nagariensis]|eukprot:XP_002946889.1 trypsin family [Volvox carteri f. nagariensis]